MRRLFTAENRFSAKLIVFPIKAGFYPIKEKDVYLHGQSYFENIKHARCKMNGYNPMSEW